MMKHQYHKDGTLPKPDNKTVFVFGSNLAGIHGAGAALVAHLNYNYPYGVACGFNTTNPNKLKAYGIATKDTRVVTHRLEDIALFIDVFISDTKLYPELNFFVTRVGCGLAGYTDSEIAPLFKSCGTNCSFAEEWKPFLEDEV